MKPVNHCYERSTGAVVTVYWSRRGDFASRKQRWGARAITSWGAIRLHGDTWHIPRSISHEEIRAIFESGVLKASDRAVVVFPHGTKAGAAGMSVHTYNC